MANNLQVPNFDREIGLEAYSTTFLGIGGRIKREVDDFVVEEVLEPSFLASVRPEGPYLLCRLAKRGLDTFQAVEVLRSQLKCSRGAIGFGGLKDARAETIQHVTIRGRGSSQIIDLRAPRIKLEPLGYVASPLTSKMIMSNRFKVVIRDSAALPDNEALIGLTKFGFANFFGYQRFGSRRPISHEVGRLIVKRHFQDAVECYVGKGYAGESDETRHARQMYREGSDITTALKDFPFHLAHERTILKHLVKHPEDYVGALKRLPLNLLKLFLHAYQSLLFNRQLSRLILGGSITSGTSGSEALPVPGYLTQLSEEPTKRVLSEIMREEDVSPRDFYVGPLWMASPSGADRASFVVPSEFRVDNVEADQVRLSFELPRGSYGTVLLREIMKPADPVHAGL